MSDIFEGVTYIAIEDIFETLTKYPPNPMHFSRTMSITRHRNIPFAQRV